MCQEIDEHLRKTNSGQGDGAEKEVPEIVIVDSDDDMETTSSDVLRRDLMQVPQPVVLMKRLDMEATLQYREQEEDIGDEMMSNMNPWRCLLCKEQLPDSIPLRHHLKEHFSGQVRMN